MSPIKAATWIFKFVASLALMFGLTYGTFLVGVYGVATYQEYQRVKQEARQTARKAACEAFQRKQDFKSCADMVAAHPGEHLSVASCMSMDRSPVDRLFNEPCPEELAEHQAN